MGLSQSSYIGALVFATLLFWVIFKLTGAHVEISSAPWSQLIWGINGYFLLVIGIIMPIWTEPIVSMGATRTQYAVTLLIVGAILALCNWTIGLVAGLIEGSISNWMSVAWALIYAYGIYLLGWVASLGILFKRVITGILGFVSATALAAVAMSPVILATLFDPSLLQADNFAAAYDNAVLVQSTAITAVLVVLVSTALVVVMRRLPLKA
jgi:hypothetical protein